MKSAWEISGRNGFNDGSRALRRQAMSIIACVGLSAAMVSCSSHGPRQSPKTLAEIDASGMRSDELARFVFDHHGCKNCHTLGQGGKLGFTDRGKEVGQNFEGCIAMLTAMNVIAQVPEQSRSAEEKRKAARFQEFGCTFCHQVTPGKLGLTEVGSKLASLHMACTDVQRVLSQR